MAHPQKGVINMKLIFIKPKDKIELLKDGLMSKSDEYHSFKKIPKGSILEVSQVYIRNRGWYPSSITFKVLSGSLLNKILSSQKSREIAYLEKLIRGLKEEISLLESKRADFSYYKKRGNILYRKGSEEDWQNFRCFGLLWKSFHIDNLRRDVINKEKQIQSLKKKKIKNKTSNQVIRVLVPDIEKWDVKLIKAK